MAAPTRYLGKNVRAYFAGYVLHHWLRNIKISMSGDNPTDSTIGQDDETRTEDGQIDGSMSYSGVADDSDGAVNEVLEAALGEDKVVITVALQGDLGQGEVAYCMQGVENSYSKEGDHTDVLMFDGGAEGDAGPERCIVAHPLAARTSSSQGTALDNGAATTKGGSAYIQCTEATSPTSLAVIIQASATGAFSGEETTIGTFTTITAAHKAERIEFSASAVPRYLRVKWTISGTSFTFQVSVHRD